MPRKHLLNPIGFGSIWECILAVIVAVKENENKRLGTVPMTRNVSAVVDDEIYDFIEEVRKEQGVLKSKSINNMLKEMMLKRKSQSKPQEIKAQDAATPSTPMETSVTTGQSLLSQLPNHTSQPAVNTSVYHQASIPSPHQASIPSHQAAIPSSIPISSPTGVSPHNPTIISPNPTLPQNIPPQDKSIVNDSASAVKTEVKPAVKPASKPALKPYNRYSTSPTIMKFKFGSQSEERRMTTPPTEDEPVSDRERYKKYREEEENERKMKDLYDRVKNTHLRVCEDGDCFRKELAKLGKDVEEIKESRKVDQELVEVRKGLDDLKKNVTRMEVCPECGEKSIVHMSSYCSNCGSKVNEWTDDTGSKIASWKPYWERIRKV